MGGGPSGLEAARVAAERGHDVSLFEAARELGGQVQLAARATQRRSDLIGITGWLASECRHLGVDLRTSTYAEADEVLALAPDVVIVATGGSPRMPDLAEGVDLAVSTWDIIAGSVSPSTGDVLLFDDHGTEEGLSCVERLVAAGSHVELVTPDRHVGHEVTGTAYPRYLATFYEHGVRLTPDHRMTRVRRDGTGRLEVDLWNDYTKSTTQRIVDQVVVAYGTTPNDSLYLDLIERSSNRGELDLDAFLAGRPQGVVADDLGTFQLFRTGDAVASRNIHAAIYEARRIAMTL